MKQQKKTFLFLFQAVYLFVHFVVSVFYSLAVEDFSEFTKSISDIAAVHYTCQHMPCLVAIVDCTHEHHVIRLPGNK